MTINAEIEMRWVNAWNDLCDLVAGRWQVNCLLPDGSVVNIDVCKGWLQDSAYEGYCLTVEAGWVEGKRGVVVSRFRESSK